MSSYSERITILREKAGLTQALLAFDCGWRISRLSNYETGYRSPKLQDIEIIGNVLDQYLGSHTIVYLMTGSFLTELTRKKSISSKKQFTPEKAVTIFKEVISNAIEFGQVKTAPGSKLTDLVRVFSKSCYSSLSGNQKSSQL